MKTIAAAQSAWWEDWLAEPKLRQAPYAYLPKDGEPDICVRHRPAYLPPPADYGNSTPLNEAIRLMRSITETRRRRILRLANERGGGKGCLFHELQTGRRFEQLFPETLEGMYAGAFFAHTSFSPEFSSVIAALVRFVARHTSTQKDIARVRALREDLKNVPDVELFENDPHLLRTGPNDETPLWPEDEVPNTLSQLRKVFRRLQDTSRNRLFICLSGLERLCDRKGDAYSSAHRAFFRTLTSKEFEDLPVDLVLIAGDPDQPVRVLSEEGLAPWPLLPRLPFCERYWLKETATGPRFVTAEDKGDLASAPILKTLMEESVALDSWVSLCARECFDAPRPRQAGKGGTA